MQICRAAIARNIIGSGQTGMTAEYTDGLELHNVQINPSSRPAFHAAHSTSLALDGRIEKPNEVYTYAIVTIRVLKDTDLARIDDKGYR